MDTQEVFQHTIPNVYFRETQGFLSEYFNIYSDDRNWIETQLVILSGETNRMEMDEMNYVKMGVINASQDWLLGKKIETEWYIGISLL